jgi:hypothetical protein
MMENALEIKTRAAPNIPDRKQRFSEIAESLINLNMDYLKLYYRLFLGERPKAGLNKAALVSAVSAAASFEDEGSFRKWFFSLPVLTQNLLCRLAFDYYIPVEKLEKELGLSLVHRVNEFYWDDKWALHKNLDLDFLRVYSQYQKAFVVLPHVLRLILVDWLVPPPELSLANCVFDAEEAEAGPIWDNSAEVADSLPLLFDAMADFFRRAKPAESPYRCIRGFKKNDAKDLQASSAFKPFNVPAIPPETGNQKTAGRASAGPKPGDLVPDSVDITARFILAMTNFSPVRPQDGQDEVKSLVSAFFSEQSQYRGYVNPPDRHSLEYNVLFDHVTKYSDHSLRYKEALPYSRRIFQEILIFCAKNGGTFDADKVAAFIYRNAQNFAFYYDDTERYLKYKAGAISVDGATLTSYNDEFYLHGALEYYLLTAPLFKAYCYLFAALGLLEIRQAAPPLARIRKEKKQPLSPYDSLKSFRATEFGKWCLGLTGKRPERPRVSYQAIADKELFLVTVQGTSLERAVYLDKIGSKLGGDSEKGSRAESGTSRWKVSPGSFIAGCVNKEQIQDRIAKFQALIDPAPAPHWIALFEKALIRAGLFDQALDNMLVYQLPADRTVAEELLRDTDLRSLVHRAEGGLLVVPEKNRKKFLALLNAHGIAVFED